MRREEGNDGEFWERERGSGTFQYLVSSSGEISLMVGVQEYSYADRKLAANNAKVMRPTLFNYIATREEFDHYGKELFKYVTQKDFNITIHETYPLEDVARAQSVSCAGT